VGWLLLALGLSVSASGPAEAYTNYGVARAGAVPAADLVAVYLPATVVTAIACLGFLLLLTPTGALPSPRWRWWARVTAATPVALLLVVTLAPKPGGRLAQAVDNPSTCTGFTACRWPPPRQPSPSRTSPSWWPPPPWWSASAAPRHRTPAAALGGVGHGRAGAVVGGRPGRLKGAMADVLTSWPDVSFDWRAAGVIVDGDDSATSSP
jgi:hypothetical protein